MLGSIAGKAPRIIERYDSRTANTYRSARFYTKSVLKRFRSDFYQGRKKVLPSCIGDLLDPMAVAVWFMDDGGRGAHTPRGLVINTSCFSWDEQRQLRSVLESKFDIAVSIHEIGSGFQLYIRSRSFKRFSDLITPYLVVPMRYKIPVDPVTTSPANRRDGDSVREREPIYGRHKTSALTPSVR